jgi:ferrochelatase
MNKTAVVLFNLGGPSNLGEVRGFLFRLFYDRAIINLPNPLRWLIARIISSRREETAKEIYKKMGGGSTILEETERQKRALEKELGDKSFKVFIAMRYSLPNSKAAAREISKHNPDEVIMLPLYPQFSTTTTGSSVEDMNKALKGINYKRPVKTIGCYFAENNFIEAHVSKIRAAIDEAKNKKYRIIFSAHSLPEKIIKSGDPYQWQIEQTAQEIVKKLKIKDLDYRISYQSKVTPVKWIGPDTESEIIKASNEKEAIILVPIAFVSEHSETLIELDIEYREKIDEKKVKYIRVPALGVQREYIKALANLVKSFSAEKKSLVSSDKMFRICPSEHTKCICGNRDG